MTSSKPLKPTRLTRDPSPGAQTVHEPPDQPTDADLFAAVVCALAIVLAVIAVGLMPGIY